MNLTNQIEKAMQMAKSRTALEKAKSVERKKVAKGHRYFAVSNRTKILVECDKDGNPTERGLRQIEAVKKQVI